MDFSVPEFEQRHRIECLQERNRYFPGSERAVLALMAHPSFLDYIICIETARRSVDEEQKHEQWDEALFIQSLILDDLAHRATLTNEDFLAAQDFMLNRTRNEEPLIVFSDEDIQFSVQ